MTMSMLRLDSEIPTFHAFAAMYWLAGAAALMSALLVIPMWRRREYADESPLQMGTPLPSPTAASRAQPPAAQRTQNSDELRDRHVGLIL